MSAAIQAPWSAEGAAGIDAGAAARDDVYARASRVLAAAAVAVLGVHERVGYGATAALPVAIVLLPLWLPAVRRYALATLIVGLAALSAVTGLVLGELSSADHVVSGVDRLQAIGLLASGIAAFGLVLWAGSLLPLHRIALLYGAGGLASVLVRGDLSWKYDLAVPTTFVVLGALERRRRGLLPAAVLLALGLIGLANDARSYFGVCALAATLALWQLRPARRIGPVRLRDRGYALALLAGIGVAVYFLTSALATGGAFGADLQERSAAQISRSGSLIAGGRPEWAATRELFALDPAGYGAGVAPNWTDRMAGKAGLASLHVDAGGYADHYMFGRTFELHSVAADLWVRFGWAGVALAAAIVVVIFRSLMVVLGARRAPAFLIFACVLALWYVLFGPLYSNWVAVCVALGLAAVAAGPRPAASTTERAAP
jgi:hypothetical protein